MDMKRQLVDASTSSGANYPPTGGQGSPTRPDTKSKIGISLQEIRESNFFLRVFYQLKLGDVKRCEYLITESSELKRILASIINKL